MALNKSRCRHPRDPLDSVPARRAARVGLPDLAGEIRAILRDVVLRHDITHRGCDARDRVVDVSRRAARVVVREGLRDALHDAARALEVRGLTLQLADAVTRNPIAEVLDLLESGRCLGV